MILIVGGEGSGKRGFARSLGYADEDMADGILDRKPVIFHTEKLTMSDPESAVALSRALMQKEIVICNEVGSGIIPVRPQERRGREATGRLCILLAQEAEAVVRMVCGIPCVIKGQLPSGEPPCPDASPIDSGSRPSVRSEAGTSAMKP